MGKKFERLWTSSVNVTDVHADWIKHCKSGWLQVGYVLLALQKYKNFCGLS